MSCQHQAKARRDPYVLFFSIGAFSTLMGVAFWPLKNWGMLFGNHTSQTHVFLQIFGFLLSFVIGFLTTAFPRLTETAFLKRFELLSLTLVQLLLIGAILGQRTIAVYVFFILNLVLLGRFLLNRFLVRKKPLPMSFVYLPFAFGIGIAGGLVNLLALSELSWVNPKWLLIGTHAIYYGFTLFLFLGISGFLVRSILGWEPRASFVGNFWRLVMATLILLSFAFVGSRFEFYANLVRAILCSVELIMQVQLYKKPISQKLAAYSLWLSLWMIVLGLWLLVFLDPLYRVDLFHATYLGGVALGTLAIASRVVLSHSGYSELLQGKIFKPFAWVVCLLFLALVTRSVAGFLPDIYYQHLNYAGLFWIVGILIWTFAILKKAFIKKKVQSSL